MSNTKTVMGQASNQYVVPPGLDITDVFSTYLYTGTGSALTIINGIDLAGEGGMVWWKPRSGTYGSDSHRLANTERGADYSLSSNNTNAEFDVPNFIFSSFNSDGFTLGTDNAVTNTSTDSVTWTFRKAPKFFDVVTYTGTGSAQTIAHNLGTNVGWLLIKRTDSTGSWFNYHNGLSKAGNPQALILNETGAAFTANASLWNLTYPTSTHFTVGDNSSVNASGGTYVAYVFAHNDGDGEFGPNADQDIIKCGSLTTASSGFSEVNLGWEPQWILVKYADGTQNWYMYDNMRGINDSGKAELSPNLSSAESTSTAVPLYLTPTGFNFNADYFGASRDFIYMAIRRGPLAQPESATEVFDIADMSSFVNTHIVNITPDAALLPWRTTSYDDGTNSYPEMFDRLRGKGGLQTSNNRAENTGRTGAWDYMDRFTGVYATGGYMWKRAPGFFDVVAYSGDAVAGRTVSHNLGVAPEMIWVKKRNAARSWIAYHSGIGSGKYLELDNTSAAGTVSTVWYDTVPTSTNFTVGTNSSVNQVPDTYIAYLFASLPGISKVGSYTGNGTSQTIDCGFTSGARFVLVKRTDSTGGWYVWDTERGIVAGNDPFLQLNSATAELTGDDSIDPDSSGFIVNQTDFAAMNVSGGEYIFYAIA